MEINYEVMKSSSKQEQEQHVITRLIDFNPKPTKAANYFRNSISPSKSNTRRSDYSEMTYNTMTSTDGSNDVHTASVSGTQTPPPKRRQKVRNPFEADLIERLHLPLIVSPSLFQYPEPPQMSSTQCEWTIDEMSRLMPMNVEPHESQFSDSSDSELEAKAQMAISSFFKEHCPLREKRIKLNDLSDHTPTSKPERRIRDCSSQTELSLPYILPTAIEELLKPHFQSHLAGFNTKEFKKSRYGTKRNSSAGSSVNSLKREQFDIHNIVILENKQNMVTTCATDDNTNSNPISLQYAPFVGKLSDPLGKSSFVSWAPISNTDGLSPIGCEGSATKDKSRFEDLSYKFEYFEKLSPIQHLPQQKQRKQNLSVDLMNAKTQEEKEEEFSPKIFSSLLTPMSTRNIAEVSSDTLQVEECCLKNKCTAQKYHSNGLQDNDIGCMCHEEKIVDMLESTGNDEEMQVSQMSVHSCYGNSLLSDTSKGSRRSVSYHSFFLKWLNDCDDREEEKLKETVKPSLILKEKGKKKL